MALFVGAFLIFNTFSITVAQRVREFGMLRTLGASRRQILASVVVEALLIGLVGAVLGILGGLLLREGLKALFNALGIDLPTTALVIETRTVVVSLLIGIVVTLVSVLIPALRSTRVPPIAALQELELTRQPPPLDRHRGDRRLLCSAGSPWCWSACSATSDSGQAALMRRRRRAGAVRRLALQPAPGAAAGGGRSGRRSSGCAG